MSTPDPAVLEARLERLETETCHALVADLWAARGFETTTAGDLVLARRGDRSVTVWPVGADGPRTPEPPESPIDVVVAPGGSRLAERVADRRGARLLDAGDLGEMLRYALDRPAANAVCTRHLGAAMDELRPPLGDRIVARAREAGSAAPLLPVVATVLVLVTGGAIGGLGLVGPPAAPVTPADTVATPADDPPPTTAESIEGAAAIPGVTRAGIVNLSALTAAHRRVLAGRSYTLRLDTHRPEHFGPTTPRVHRSTAVSIVDDRYLLRTTRTRVGGTERPVRTVYHAGTAWYVRAWNGDNASYRRFTVDDNDVTVPVGPDPTALWRTTIVRYLSTPETSVTDRVTRDGDLLYRIVGTGAPLGPWFGKVRNYSVVALVDRRGFIRRLAAEYMIIRGQRAYWIRFELAYDRIGTTVVDRPAWVTRRFAGNATETPTADE